MRDREENWLKTGWEWILLLSENRTPTEFVQLKREAFIKIDYF